MVLMVVLSVVVAAGIVVAFSRGGLEVSTPWSGEDSPRPVPVGETLRRYLWFVALAVGAGMVSGVVMMGAGGRLAMRLLAVTAGPQAQGRLTEAQEIVGEISVGGTIGFIVFVGILGGLITGAGYVLVAALLPGGRLRGLAFGALLLLLGATRVDPLRPDNLDFDIVGPGWVAVSVFVALALIHGMLVAAIAGLYSRRLPLPSKSPKALIWYAPLLIFIPGFFLLTLVVGAGLVALAVTRSRSVVDRLMSPAGVMVGRAVIALAALVALPGFTSGVVDIL